MAPLAIDVHRVGKCYRLRRASSQYETLRGSLGSAVRRLGRSAGQQDELWALRDVSFSVDEGEAVGIIGANGAGKTTLLRILTRITEPSSGVSRTRGRIGSLLDVGTGFHPELSGRDNVFLSGAILGMSRADIRRRFDEIVSFAGTERFLDAPLKQYSSGMKLRLAFAVAAHLEPDIVVVDEVLAVGDAEFQEKCLTRMSALGREGRTVVFVSHDLRAITQLCPRGLWLDAGSIVLDGRSDEVVERYLDRQVAPGLSRELAGGEDADLHLHWVGVTDKAGGPIEPRRDRPFEIRARFRARRWIPEFDASIWIANDEHVRVLDEFWSERKRLLPPWEGQRDIEATLRVPPVLEAGEYTIGVSAWAGREEFFKGELLTFQLAESPADSRIVPMSRIVRTAEGLDLRLISETVRS